MKSIIDYLGAAFDKNRQSESLYVDSRSRILLHHEKKLLFVVNFKCGFTTLNHVAEMAGLDLSHKDLRHLEKAPDPHDIRGYKKVLVARNPLDRFYSYYYGWLVDKGEFFQSGGKKIANFAYRIMREVMTRQDYNKFVEADKADRASSELIDLYLDYLPVVLMRNEHTHPQFYIYTLAGLSVKYFDEIIDTKQISTRLSAMLEMDIPVANRSSYDARIRAGAIDDDRGAAVIKSIYKKDFADLGYPL